MVGGVCAGIGDFFGLDHSVVRLIFVLGMLLGFGSFFFIYLVMWIVVPEEPGPFTPPTVPPVPPVE
jgi:phage shock protein PspC (stress-responsive transcriptional regulator)